MLETTNKRICLLISSHYKLCDAYTSCITNFKEMISLLYTLNNTYTRWGYYNFWEVDFSTSHTQCIYLKNTVKYL